MLGGEAGGGVVSRLRGRLGKGEGWA